MSIAWRHFYFALLTCLLILTFSSKPAFAAENFITDYNVSYSVLENENTRSLFNVTFTNTSEQYYASSYKIQVGFENIANVKASDEGGVIAPTITKTPTGQAITLAFNKPVIGKGNKLNFSLSFDTPDIAQKNGSIWEINIPGITNQHDFASFNVDVRVPQDFGRPTYIKPKQLDDSLYFTKSQLENSGISIAFGNKQVYAFHLSYHMQNNNIFPIRTEIALPPTTNYQEVYIEDIQPRPTNVYLDKDGNWLAEYTLLPSQKKDVIVNGNASISLIPQPVVLTAQQHREYTKERPYWQVSNDEIKKLASSLRTPEAIYEYVTHYLTYDFSRVATNQPRLGAVQVLKTPSSAVCREFTDLFITIARAANIPAREVNGYAYTENAKQRPLSLIKDILHSWPEYYDLEKETWVMIDPTWGNTTGGVDYFTILDFDHLTFVKKGIESDYPIPAGGYKLPGDEKKKDIQITFSDRFPVKAQKIDVIPNFDKHSLSGIPIRGEIITKNVSGAILGPLQIKILSQTLFPRSQILFTDSIPPFGFITSPVTFEKTPILTNTVHKITIALPNKQFVQSINVSPLYITKEMAIGGLFIVLFTIIIFIIARKAWRLRFSR